MQHRGCHAYPAIMASAAAAAGGGNPAQQPPPVVPGGSVAPDHTGTGVQGPPIHQALCCESTAVSTPLYALTAKCAPCLPPSWGCWTQWHAHHVRAFWVLHACTACLVRRASCQAPDTCVLGMVSYTYDAALMLAAALLSVTCQMISRTSVDVWPMLLVTLAGSLCRCWSRYCSLACCSNGS